MTTTTTTSATTAAATAILLLLLAPPLCCSQDALDPDPAVDHLFRQMSQGGLSVGSMCESARSTVWSTRGSCSQSLIQIAKAGTWGLHPQNVERDVHVFARAYFGLSIEKYYAPVRVNVDGREQVMALPLYPLHEYLFMLHEVGEDVFHSVCFSADGPASAQRFWNHVSHMEWFQQHPVSSDPDVDLRYCIPATMFGDDGRVYKHEKMMVWQVGFFLSKHRYSQLLLGCLPHWLVNEHTYEDVHLAILWMWKCAYRGCFAEKDHLERDIQPWHGKLRYARRGQPLYPRERRHRIIFAGFKADLQYERDIFHFHGYDQDEMCRNCPAHKKIRERIYTKIGAESVMRHSRRTTAEYRASQGDRLCNLCHIPGWHVSLHRYDPMHVLFLGAVLHMLGSVILDLAYARHWRGATHKERLQRAWLDMREWVREHGLQCSQSKFTMGAFSQGKRLAYAELKAKAHNARVMLSWIAEVCADCALEDHSQLRASMTFALADFCFQCDAWRDWELPQDLAQRLYDRGHEFLALYKTLSIWAVANRRRWFAWKPKFHYYEHLLDTVLYERLNPTWLWNYAEEDLIGTSIDLASASHRSTVPERALDRYMPRLGLAFSGRDRVPVGPPPWLPLPRR